MKKSTTCLNLGLTLLSLPAAAAVSVRYYNRDSQKYIFPARCSGSSYSLSVQGSTTGTATIQGSAPCTVQGVTLHGGENIEIKDGKIIAK